MAKLPVSLSSALTEQRFGHLAGLIARQLAKADGAMGLDVAQDLLSWSLAGDPSMALPVASVAVRSPHYTPKAPIATAREAMGQLFPVIAGAAIARGEERHLRRLWESAARWACAGQSDARARGEAVASAWAQVVPSLGRKHGREALETLGTFLRQSRRAREGFFDQIFEPESLDAMGGGEVGLKPADVVIEEMFSITQAQGDAGDDPGRLDRLQHLRWDRLERHPAGLAKLLRLDLNAAPAFQVLLLGAYGTPRRAAWVAQRVAQAQRAAGKEALAQKLEHLLGEPMLAQAISAADAAAVGQFLRERPGFAPRGGWEGVVQDLGTRAFSLAQVAAILPDLALEQRAKGLERAGQFLRQALDELMAHTGEPVPGVREACARLRAAWRGHVLEGDQVAALGERAGALMGQEQALARQWVALCLDNQFLAELDRAHAMAGGKPAAPDAAQVLVRLSGLGSAAIPERPAGKRARR